MRWWATIPHSHASKTCCFVQFAYTSMYLVVDKRVELLLPGYQPNVLATILIYIVWYWMGESNTLALPCKGSEIPFFFNPVYLVQEERFELSIPKAVVSKTTVYTVPPLLLKFGTGSRS